MHWRRPGRGVGRHAVPPHGACAQIAGAQDGSVLLETVLAIPILAAVTVCLAWGLALAGTSMALGDAVRQAARDVARGVAVVDAVAAAQSAAPAAAIRVTDEGGSVVVIAEQVVTAPVPLLKGLSVTLHQQVAVPSEWS